MAKGDVSITVDLTPAFQGLSFRKAQVEGIAQTAIKSVLEEVHRQIGVEAARGLKSTRNTYVRNINSPVIGRMKGSITLTGMLPNMLESGISAFDMKEGFSKSSKKKMKKGGGWYLTIPFRHAGAGSIGESEAFSSVMPSPINKMAKRLNPKITAFGGTISGGSSISAADLAGSKFGVIGKRALIEENGGNLSAEQKAEYKHKSPKYAGLQKSKKFYELGSGGKYGTFRRVSDKSASNSWIHKGLKARNFMTKAMKGDVMEKAASRSISASLDELGL